MTTEIADYWFTQLQTGDLPIKNGGFKPSLTTITINQFHFFRWVGWNHQPAYKYDDSPIE